MRQLGDEERVLQIGRGSRTRCSASSSESERIPTDARLGRLRAQLDTSFQMLRNARDRGISVMGGSDTGNASAFSHGRWHGKEAELRAVGQDSYPLG